MNSPYMGDFYVSQKYTHGTHDGLDLVGVTHKDIHCVESGEVVYAGWENSANHSQGFGQYVCIKNGSRYWYYGHLSSISVKVGDKVNITDIIGQEGSTGYSTGSHVHICVRIGGVKGNDLDVSQILGIPNVASTTYLNDGSEATTYHSLKPGDVLPKGTYCPVCNRKLTKDITFESDM